MRGICERHSLGCNVRPFPGIENDVGERMDELIGCWIHIVLPSLAKWLNLYADLLGEGRRLFAIADFGGQ